jgi:D-beta-D-heptose 7-phosphate kinase/D-beta-D-heptose 1-phosphate adenosyltransferase
MPGGLGNVAMNLHALGASPTALGLVGDDNRARILEELLSPSLPQGKLRLVCDPARPTTVKTRVIAGIQQVVRYDEESVEPIPPALEEAYKQAVLELLPLAGSLSLSDYGKGLLTPSLCAFLIAEAANRKVPVVVDPKGADWGRYSGATLITPNRQELSLALGRDIAHGGGDALAAGARELMERHQIKNILVTRSEDGMTLVMEGGGAANLPTKAKAVFDVSGAGDTVVSAMAASMAAGATLLEGAMLATLAAGVVVGKVGTSTATPREIRESVENEGAAD